MTITPISLADPQRKYSIFPSRNYKNIGSCEQNEKSETSFIPHEFKLGEGRVTLGDACSRAIFLARNPNILEKELVENDKGEWINGLFTGNSTQESILEFIKSYGFNDEESKELLNEAIYHSERACDWAIANENYGGLSSDSVLISFCTGILNTALNEMRFSNHGVRRVLSTAHNGLVALRGYLQYGLVYGRSDDEKGVNNYQGEVYGNKTSSIFSDLAYIFETRLNPIPMVLLGLFGNEKANETIIPLLYLPNILWWRVRMPAEVKQDFVSDLFRYSINKPLSLLKITESIRVVKEIKEKGNLNYPFIQKRLLELIGLDPAKHRLKDIFPELARCLKVMFNKDKKQAKDASHHIGRFLAPILGLYGVIAIGLGTPLKSVLKWLDIESKFINSLSMSGSASQQILYLFRIIFPEQFQNQADSISQTEPELKRLQSEKNNLFYSGITTCSASIIATLLKLVNPENKLFKLAGKVIDQMVDKGIPYYFSKRRELRGKGFRLLNPELYNLDGTAKIISDKVKEQGYKLQSVEGVAG